MSVTLNASTSSGLVQTADTSGTIELQSNGTTKLSVLSTGVSGTIINGTAVASTSGTSIDFTSIPSWVKRITVMFNGVSTNSTSNFLIQLGDSGGIENTGYSARAITLTNNSSATSTAGLIVSAIVAAANATSGSIIISLQDSTTNTWVAQGVLMDPTNYLHVSSGVKATSATLDRIRITTVTPDTFDAGSINILYEG
jgi:hypothetical protein